MIDSMIPEPIKTISQNDEMYTGNNAHYFSVGRSALHNLIYTINLADMESCKSILDMPCGHGRVCRYLRAKFPNAKITVCDINQDAVDFCVETFGAKGVYASKNLEDVNINAKFDLIWCGSLLTHLDRHLWQEYFNFFCAHLHDQGVLVFTTHGRLSIKWLYQKHMNYGLNENDVPLLLHDYERDGFSYLNYPGSSDYGVSVSSPAWILAEIEKNLRFKIIFFTEAGWDNHQDVISCVRMSESWPTTCYPRVNMRGGESFCFTSDRESLFRELVSLREQVVESQREIQRLKGSESYQVGLFCTWPFRKAWRIIRKACNEDPKGHLARNNS